MPAPVIVSYQRIQDALSPQLETVAAAGLEASTAELGEPEAIAHLSRALQMLEAEQGPEDVMVAPRDQVASLLQTFLARQALETNRVEPLPGGAMEAQFDEHDILGWAGSFFRWWKRLIPHDFVPWDGTIERLPNQARVAILSDWGSGLYGAPECSRSIQNDPHGFDLVLHLGDVYYAGDDDEVRDRLLAIWPQVDGALNRTLNGNHEMYTGGNAYFSLALREFAQQSSFCVLENDHWLLAGLDTAYTDHRLHGDQGAWLRQLVARAEGRRLLLFSHHQPYSIMEALGRRGAGNEPGLVSDLADLLAARQVFAWYWGHEHYCVIYDDHPFWGLKGRCVGHSGFPEFRPKLDLLGEVPSSPEFRRVPTRNMIPGGSFLDGPNPHIVNHERRYCPHGYVTLELDGAHLVESYFEAGGERLHQVEIA